MVYPGRPSQGCGVCRKRRVKCDEGKPTCENCNTRDLLCSGYRDWSELHFRNQSLAIVSSNSTPEDGTKKKTCSSIPEHHRLTDFTCTIEDLALENFFSNFVRPQDPSSVHKGYFQVLPDLWLSSPASSALHSATTAFALATYCVDACRRDCISRARAAYALTLNRIQQELKTNPTLEENHTLLAVLLMQVIEALLESASIEAKPQLHLNGAMTILKLRGIDGFQDETSQILLSSARAQGIMSSFGRSLNLPTPFDGTQRHYIYDFGPLPDTTLSENPFRTTGLLHHISQVAELLDVYNRISTSELYNASDILDLIERCKSCDIRLLQWADSARASWRHVPASRATVNMTRFPDSLGRTDTYNDVFIARSWNYYRVARIFILFILTRCFVYSDTEEVPASSKSFAWNSGPESSTFQGVLMDIVDDICASVPFHLGRCSGYEWSATGVGAYFLLWPLLLTQEALPDDSVQKIWITDQLLEIGRSLGLGQSKMLSKVQEASLRRSRS